MAWPRMVALEITESSVILDVHVYMVELTGFPIDSVMMVRKRGLEDRPNHQKNGGAID